mmetsp:Transcript_9718/g.19620  ORF Transcript_9718/g.19620 Transcript_9718/m.19620 type:complete len:143 (-) Transcript_9718:244-672(-)
MTFSCIVPIPFAAKLDDLTLLVCHDFDLVLHLLSRSMSKWNHDGWHQDGWQDDGWNDDGHNQMGWKGDDERVRLRQCDLSDCCEADRRGRDFSLYNRFIRSENSDGFCRLSGQDGGTAQREQCNRRGFCYATGENCQPSDCR